MDILKQLHDLIAQYFPLQLVPLIEVALIVAVGASIVVTLGQDLPLIILIALGLYIYFHVHH